MAAKSRPRRRPTTKTRQSSATPPSAPERLLDLLALFMSRRRSWLPSEIFAELPGAYAGEREAQNKKLMRDRRELESLGVVLQYVADPEDPDYGYRIDPSAAYLPDVKLAPEEQAGLFAVGAAALEGGAPFADALRDALVKLRAGWSRPSGQTTTALYVSQGAPPHLATLTEAIASRRLVNLAYDDTERTFAPWVVARGRGRVLVVGWCHLRGAVRSFHVGRIAACAFSDPARPGPDYDIPADFDPTASLVDQPWQLPLHPPVEVTLDFAPPLAEVGPRVLGLVPGATCLATNLDGLAAQLLSLGDGATIVSPPEARARLCTLVAELT